MTFIFKIAILNDFKIFIIVFIVFVILDFSSLKMSAEKKTEEDFKVLNKN